MQSAKFFSVLLCFLAILHTGQIVAQPSQLPSLFAEDDAENDYFQNAVLKPGEVPSEKINSLIFIKTSLSKKECFVGEPVLVTYQLYSAISCHSRVTKQVSFSGCSVIEMTSEEPEQLQKEKNKLYRVQLIRRVQLIPLQPGNLTIPPATVNNDVSFATTDNPYLQKSYSADVSSQPTAIQVNRLPTDKPEDFTGVTGKFTIKAKADTNVIAAGESNRLQITIAGVGNIEAVTEPRVSWPKNTEHFEVEDSQHINRLNFPESGDKTYIIPFVSNESGKITIPEVRFTYFNTDLKKFETISTSNIPLLITEALHSANKATAMVSGEDVSNRKYLWIVPGIAAFVLAGWIVTSRKPKKTVTPIEHVPENVDITPIIMEKEAEPEHPDYDVLLITLNEAEDNKTFFSGAKELLFSALQHCMAPEQTDEEELLNQLGKQHETLAAEAKQVVAVCNEGLYSPVESEEVRTHIINRLTYIINRLVKC